jgi:LPS-assembly lipoprotein
MRKALTTLLLLPLLAGCGFRPMYGDTRLEPQFKSIYVEPVADADGYELRNTLISLLGADGNARGKAYRLHLTLNETNRDVVIENNTTDISRYNDTLVVNYTLTDAKGTEITHGSQSSLASYNVAPSPYATLSTQQDSDKRAAEDIADRIRMDLGAFFDRRGGR